MDLKANFALFKSLLAKLVWVYQSRPDIFCAKLLLNRISEKRNIDKATHYIKKANKILDYLHSTNDLVLNFPKFEKETVCLRVYSDASYA